MTDYVEDVKKYAKKADEDAVAGIVKHCGIALRSKDASMVSCSQKPELDRVRDSFLKKKLERSAMPMTNLTMPLMMFAKQWVAATRTNPASPSIICWRTNTANLTCSNRC